MKTRNGWRIAIAATASALACAGWWRSETEEPVERSRPSVSETANGDDRLERLEPRTGVGWVFGRVVGFPGAHRPLTASPGGALP